MPPWREPKTVVADGWPGRRSAPAPAGSFAGAAHLRAGRYGGQASEDHVGTGQAVGVAMLQEQESVRIGDVVGWRLAERAGRGVNRILAAFDLDEHPHRRFIDRDYHIV